MKILVLSPTFLPAVGGAEIVLWEVSRRLADPHSVLLLTPQLSEDLIRHYSHNAPDYPLNFPVTRYNDTLTLMSIPGHGLFQGAIPPFSLSAVFAVRKALRTFKPDVLNVHYTMPTGLAGAIADTFWGIPSVLTLNGRDVPGPGVPVFWKYWHRIAASFYSGLTYVSDYCRDIVFGTKGPGTVTWNGVDFNKIHLKPSDHFRERLGIPKGARVLFALQRLSKEKRVDIVLKALPRIRKAIPDSYLIIGGTGPEKERLHTLVQDLDLAKHVLFTDFIDDIRLGDYFNLCDVFLFHSTYETFGIVLAQAMAYAKPIVSVYNTAIPGVVKDRECGILVPPFSPERMADAAIELLNDEGMRTRMGNQGRARAQELFDWNIIASKYEAALVQAIASKGKKI